MSKGSHVQWAGAGLRVDGAFERDEDEDPQTMARCCTNKYCKMYLMGFCNKGFMEKIECPLPAKDHMALKLVPRKEMIRAINGIKTSFSEYTTNGKEKKQKEIEIGTKLKMEGIKTQSWIQKEKVTKTIAVKNPKTNTWEWKEVEI